MNNAKAGFHSVDYMTTPTTARRRLSFMAPSPGIAGLLRTP